MLFCKFNQLVITSGTVAAQGWVRLTVKEATEKEQRMKRKVLDRYDAAALTMAGALLMGLALRLNDFARFSGLGI
jgi:hypothetical protein